MKVVVQCSGGIESTVLLAWTIKQQGADNVFPITFNDDSVLYKAKDRIAVKRVVTNFQLQRNLFTCNVPQADYLEYIRDRVYEDVGFVPGMKLIYNTASMAFAQRVGAKTVFTGNMGDNVYPDEDPKLIAESESLYNKIYTSDGPDSRYIVIESPFRHKTKAQVIQLGNQLGVDLSDTISCGDERTGALHCGVCAWCQKRRAAFIEAGIEDKTRYLWD